jgi:phospholipid/cholesterol/gamma-HCH transport system substrate-binding protein
MGFIRKSFLERNQKLIGLIGALLVAAGTTFALLLSGGVFADTFTVTAEFADAAGLRPDDDVVVAGLEAGSVDALEINGGVVEVTMKVDDGIELPKDSRAEIVVETLLGRKSVNLIAGSDDAMLEDGDEIPLDRTVTPIELVELANRSEPLLRRSDPRAFQDFLNEITKITRGKRRQAETLITGFTKVTGVINARGKQLSRLLDSLDTLAATFAERDDTLVSLIDNLHIVLGNLSERTADVKRLLRRTDAASNEVAFLVERNRGNLDSTLRNLHSTLQVLDRQQVDLAASISYLEQSVQGYSSVGYSQGIPNRWANIFVQSLGPLGVDTLIGRCGTFDEALDELLGKDPRNDPKSPHYDPRYCEKNPDYDKEEEEGEDNPLPPLPSPLPSLPPPGGGNGFGSGTTEASGPGTSTSPGLPGDVGDLLDDATGEEGLATELGGDLP